MIKIIKYLVLSISSNILLLNCHNVRTGFDTVQNFGSDKLTLLSLDSFTYNPA